MKQVLSILLSFVLIAGYLMVPVSAAEANTATITVETETETAQPDGDTGDDALVIAKIGETGFETTQVIAQSVITNGVDLGTTLSQHLIEPIHVDPDDWIEQDMLSTLYETAMSENADMVICDFYWDKDNVSRVVSQRPSSLVTSDVLTDLFRHLHGNCWNKLIRRETYRKYDVKYVPKITFCEDLLFNVELLTNPVKVAYVSKAFYHYVQCENENSLSRTYTYETLAKDTHLKSLVMKLTRGLICEKESEYFMDSMIVKRAFFSALFSSSAFKTAFYSFRKSVSPRS